jgi:energy-coupling factor transporter ATP-binding protein EcfA2
MKELLVVSGKGGTGKTTIVGTLAVLAKDTPLIRNPVLADCDVDAADLHLILNPATKESKEFFGLKKAGLDRDKCDNCKILTPPETRIELSIQVFLQSRYCYLHCFEAPFSTISVQFMPCVNASLSYSSIRPRSHNLARSGSRRTAPKYGIPADLARSAPLLGPNK